MWEEKNLYQLCPNKYARCDWQKRLTTYSKDNTETCVHSDENVEKIGPGFSFDITKSEDKVFRICKYISSLGHTVA